MTSDLTVFLPPSDPDAAAALRAPEHQRRAEHVKSEDRAAFEARIRAGRLSVQQLRDWGIA